MNQIPNVWIIGAWDLDIICYLLFGAWNFLNSKTQLQLFILFDFFYVFVGHHTRFQDNMVFESYHQNRLAKSEKSGYFKTFK